MISSKIDRVFLLMMLLHCSAAKASGVPILWSQRTAGAISSHAVSQSGEVLVGTLPDSEIPTSVPKNLLTFFGKTGKVVWKLPITDPVKDLALSGDGKFAVVSSYGDELFALNARGKVLWKTQGTCRPYILEPSGSTAKRVLCYHDEDIDTKIGFDLFDAKGRKLSSFPIEGDILAIKISSDQKYFALGLTQGRVLTFSSSGKLLYESNVDGEIIDVGVSSGTEPQTAALFRGIKTSASKQASKKGKSEKPTPPKATLFKKGSLLASIEFTQPSGDPIQVEINSDGSRIYSYSANSGGQRVSMSLPSDPRPKWTGGVEYPGTYLHPFGLLDNFVYLAVENQGNPGNTRVNQLIIINGQGTTSETKVIPSDQGSWVYGLRVSKSPDGKHVIAAATDDGRITVYRSGY